jgi:hypothetical protein
MKIARGILFVGSLSLSGCTDHCKAAFEKWNKNETTAVLLLSTGNQNDASVAEYSAKFAAEGKMEAEKVCSAKEYSDRLLIRQLETLPERERLLGLREMAVN